MSKVGDEYVIHDSIEEARSYERKFNPNGFTHWHEQPTHKRRRSYKIDKRILVNLIIGAVTVSLPILGTLLFFMAVSGCAPAKKFNDPAAMRKIERQMNF